MFRVNSGILAGYDREQTIPKVFSPLLKATTTRRRRKSISEILVSVYSSKYKRDVNLGSYDLSLSLSLSLSTHGSSIYPVETGVRIRANCAPPPTILLSIYLSLSLSVYLCWRCYPHDDDQPRKTGNAGQRCSTCLVLAKLGWEETTLDTLFRCANGRELTGVEDFTFESSVRAKRRDYTPRWGRCENCVMDRPRTKSLQQKWEQEENHGRSVENFNARNLRLASLSLSVTVPPFSLFLDRILAGRFNLSPRTTCLSSPSLRNETSPCPALDEYEMAELLGEIERNRWGRYFFLLAFFLLFF